MDDPASRPAALAAAQLGLLRLLAAERTQQALARALEEAAPPPPGPPRDQRVSPPPPPWLPG